MAAAVVGVWASPLEVFGGVRPAFVVGVQAPWFRQHQQSTVEQVKGQLWSHWLPKCVEVFRRLPPVPINNDVKAYFRLV